MKFAPQFEKYRDRELQVLEVNYDGIKIGLPPEDLSHVTTMELDEVEETVTESKLPKSILKVADKAPLKLFTATANKYGLDTLEEEAQLVSEDWNTIAFYYKDKFKRRRPYEILKEHDKEFPINRTSSSESPSYPSGHSMMGYGLAEFYKEKYPYLADEWDNIADIIAHSRLQLGVHFPSDNKASKSIVDQVTEMSKTASLYTEAVEAIKKIKVPKPEIPNVNKTINASMSALEEGLRKLKFTDMADSVKKRRASRVLQKAIEDSKKYNITSGADPLARIVLPREELTLKDLKSIGFLPSNIAVPEVGQSAWTSFRHPLHNTHVHQHKDLLTLHVDDAASTSMATVLNSLEDSEIKELLPYVPQGIKINKKSLAKSYIGKNLSALSEGLKHSVMEGTPGYLGYFGRVLTPGSKGLSEAVLDKLPEDYLKKTYGYTRKTASERLRTTIFGVDPEGKLLHGFGGQGFYKFPGGGVDAGESITDAAKRELLEEAGYDVESIEELPGLDTVDAVSSGSAKGHMGHGSSRTKYLLARLGKRNQSLLGSEGDAIANLQTAPLQEVLEGLEGDIIFGSGIAESNYTALSKVRELLSKQASENTEHVLVTGHSGAGKSTYAKQLAAELGLPVHDLDEPTFKYIDSGKYKYKNIGWPIGLSERVVSEALEMKDPHVIEGTQLHYVPKMTEGYRRLLVDVPEDRVIEQRANREYLKRKMSGREPNELAKHRLAAKALLKYYRDSVNRYKELPGVELVTPEIKEQYLKKNANDLSVLTAVPKQNLDLIMRKGLASQKAISEDPEMTEAFLRHRDLKEEDWRKELSEALKGHKPASRLGPSVFFSEPDPDKVSDPRHFINQFDTTKLRVNLGKLLKDIPETKFHGVELEPFNEEAYEADKDNYYKRRHRDLTTDEISSLIAKDPKELWQHYKEEYLGKLYAGDVPHGMVITPSGIIPPEYLEQVEKTSSIDLLTGRMGAGKSTLLNKIRDQYDIVEGTDLGSVVDGKFVEPASEDKPRLRQEKADRLLAAHQAGKRVLMEGYPPGLFRIPGMVEAADRAVILEPDLIQRLTQIGNRSKERGTSVEEDIRYAVSPEHSSKEQKYLDMLSEAIGGTHVAPTSQDAEAYLLGKQVEKTSEAKPDLNNFIKYIEEEARKRGVKDMHVVMSHPDHPLGGGSAHYTTDLDKDSKSALLVKALRGKMREWEQQQGLDPDHDWDKTSSAKEQLKHILVTGHSGAGKTTYARQLAEQLGIPLHRLDVTTGPIMESEYPEYWDKGTLGYPEDVSTRVIQQALSLDKPHVIEGSHILELPELTEGYKRILIDTPEDRVIEQRAQREYRNRERKGKPYRPIEKHREAAKELANHYRDIVNNFRNQPGVESIVPEVKTSEAKRLYHGSPLDLEELELRVPPHHTGKEEAGEAGVYAADNPIAAALYALARNKSRGSWGVTKDNRLVMKDYKELNPEGYVYELDSKDYTAPPEDHPALGYTVRDPSIMSKRKITAEDFADYIDKVQTKEQFLEAIENSKTAEDQPLLRHRSTLLIRDPESGKLLAANSREDRNFNDVSPFYFPGGGLYDDEYDTPRTPTEEEILEGARREALEELGMTLRNPRVIGNTPHLLTQKAWRDKALKKRGVPYEGGHEHIVLADKGDIDNSLYNVEGDAFTKGEYYDPQEVYDSLYEYGQQGGQFSAYNVEQAKAIKEHLLNKQASLEAEFLPDFTPEDLAEMGVFDQVYGDAPSEASMKEWPEHWINKQDPLGWLQWYDRYSKGRRTEDDARQIKRWKSFKARHLAQYLKNPTLKRKAALRNWAIDTENT